MISTKYARTMAGADITRKRCEYSLKIALRTNFAEIFSTFARL